MKFSTDQLLHIPGRFFKSDYFMDGFSFLASISRTVLVVGQQHTKPTSSLKQTVKTTGTVPPSSKPSVL